MKAALRAAVVTRSARWCAAVLGLGLLPASGCTAVEDYSIRMAERSCAALNVCTVYGPNGQNLSPCISTDAGSIYPGDPRWPYTTPGVCDVVRDGRVVSSRDGG